MLHDLTYVRITGTIFILIVFLGLLIPVTTNARFSDLYDRWFFRVASFSLVAFLLSLIWA